MFRKFKVGDYVKVIAKDTEYTRIYFGIVGIISNVQSYNRYGIYVKINEIDRTFEKRELMLVSTNPNNKIITQL